MKELLRNRRGDATVLILILLPLLIIAMVGVNEVTRTSQAADVKLQQSLENAVRAAAMCVDQTAQAGGSLLIDPARADAAFRKVMARNLGLDEISLSPLSNSGVAEQLAYQLVIVNGANAYGISEVYCITSDTGYSAVSGATGPLPKVVGVSETGIDYIASNGEHRSTFAQPGCVAVISVKMKAVYSNNDFPVCRWAAAQLIAN